MSARTSLESLPEPYRSQAAAQLGGSVVRSPAFGGSVVLQVAATLTEPYCAHPWTRSEGSLQAACEVVLKRMGYPYYHAYDARRSNPGWPDLIVMLPAGRVAFIELKNDKGKQSQAQLAFMAEAVKRGHYYGVARSPEQMLMMVAEAERLFTTEAQRSLR